MITSKRVKEIFIALNLHYKSDKYDFLTFNGRLKNTLSENDLTQYNKFSQKYVDAKTVTKFFISSMSYLYLKNLDIPNHISFYNKELLFKNYPIWSANLKKMKYFHNSYDKKDIFTGSNQPKIIKDIFDSTITLEYGCLLLYKYDIDSWLSDYNDPLLVDKIFFIKKHIKLLKLCLSE